ncbi:MAG TPA: 50S ribosomal protein L29 [Opitutae bacterium]|nr:50S ribosomal protein L29 [Opitutae bacterium]|tara:strand:+ start:817 stop:1017 length:201 start_codon:yes stop_codon:yes gene_type:complete
MKAKELRELSVAELAKKLREASDELVDMKIRKQIGQLEKPHELALKRQFIARIQTLINEKSVAQNA